MTTVVKISIVLGAVFGMTVGCASNAPPPDNQSQPAEKAEPAEEPPQTQETEPREPTPPSSEPSDDMQPVEPESSAPNSVGNAEIDAFVATFRELTQVRRDYQSRLAQATTDDERRMLQEEAATAIQGVIERGELTPERFAEIANLAETDPQIARRIRDRMDAGSGDY